jgi:SAM-dependent methyltransferase
MKSLTYYFLRTFYTKYSSLKKIYKYDEVPKDILVNCPSCKSQDINDFYNMDRYGFNVRTSWCSNCGLIFVNPRINLEYYNKLYMDGSYRKIIEAVSLKKQKSLDTIPQRLTLALSKISEIYKNKEINVLDIGGTAGIYNYLNENLKIKKYLCINPGADEADIGVTSNVEVVNTTIEEYQAGDEKYDLIILFGTISHLLNPYDAFLKSRDLLKDDGLFVLDFKDNLTRMRAVNLPFTQLHFDHPIYFSKDSLETLVANVGLKVREHITYKNGVSYFFLEKENNFSGEKTVNVETSGVALMAERSRNASITNILSKRFFWNS